MNIFNQKSFCRPNNPTNSRNKWILCRSTSTLPGKHYWFNLLTGEASWSDVSENGKPQPRDLPIPSQPYKYNYQEPSSPPFDTSPNPTNANTLAFLPNYQINNYPQPKQIINHSYHQSIPNHRLTPPGFGQASFPKYFPDVPLIHERASQPLFIQTSFNKPIISKDASFSSMIRNSNDLKRKKDQVTQTFGDYTNSYVHSTSQPLHRRFQDKELFKRNYHNLSETIEVPIKRCRVTFDNTDDNIKFYDNDNLNNININNYNQNYTQPFEVNTKSNKSKNIWTTTDMNNEINRISLKEFEGDTLKIINKNLKVDKETNTDSNVQKSMFSPVHEELEDDKVVQVAEPSEIGLCNLLGKDDLRLRLLEIKAGVENKDVGNKDNKTNQNTVPSNHKPPELKKKRVTFRDDNLFTHNDEHQVNDEIEDGFYEDREPSHEVFSDNFEEVSHIKINIARLKNLSNWFVKDVWYIAVDLPSLIGDYEFLVKLVNSDTACTLLIPEQVKKTLDAQCKGSCLGRRDVMLVRHVSRDLARRRDKVCIQVTLDKKKVDVSKNILECCSEKTSRGYYVVLITTDAELRRRCKPHDIPTFTIENIKEFVTEIDQNKPKAKPSTVAFTKKIENTNATAQNSKSNENIFLGDHPRNFLESFKSHILIDNDKMKQPKEFRIHAINNISKTIMNEQNTFFPNNDGTIFKIPKLSKSTERRLDLESVVDKKLKKFTPLSKAVEQRFEIAKESWLCCFGQIVEDGLSYILQISEEKGQTAYPPPWTLLQAIKCVKLLTKEANMLSRIVVDKLLHIVYDFTVKDFINPNIRFEDFLTIFGLSYLLFEALKDKPEFFNISKETLSNLDAMFASLNDTTSEPDAIFDSKLPTVSIDICTDLVRDEGNKVIKKDADVFEYLRRHYSQFKNENFIDNKEGSKGIKVIRAFGRDINKITLTNNDNKNTILMQESTKILDENRNENYNISNDIDDCDTVKRSEAKIVRNVCIIQEMEERLLKKKQLNNKSDIDANRNENDTYNLDDCQKENFTKTNEFISKSENEKIDVNNIDTNDIDIDDMSVAKLSNVMTSDSGIVKSNESLYAQTVVEIFLSEINSHFYAVYNFINKSTSIIIEGELSSNKQQKLISKILIANEGMQNLANRIQSITDREATGSENSFRILLVKSGVDTDNVKTYRYRQVLTKCLEQIRILSNALHLLDAVARNEDITKCEAIQSNTSIGTYNIFSD